MALNYYTVAIVPGITALKNAHGFITKGHKFAQSNNIDPQSFTTASIHPDMQGFCFQVYKFTESIANVPSNLNPALKPLTQTDDQKTFEELLARIETTIKYLEGFKESDFEEGKVQEEVVIKLPGMQIKFKPFEYVYKLAHANMWFHITTAYDILRMRGVDLGKFEFLNGGGAFTLEFAG